jgi:hypothetical protein
MNWRADAACLGADPELFAQVELHTNDEWKVLEGVADMWCAGCPVLRECRAFGDEHRHTGMWGGIYRRTHQGRYKVRSFVKVDDRKPRQPARGAA